jgi:cell division septum initiation protein DivIVA
MDYLRLKEEKQELEYLWDINEELNEENKKLRERIAELEKCNLNLQEHIDKITKDRDERKRKEECSNVIIDRVKEKARENWWGL